MRHTYLLPDRCGANTPGALQPNKATDTTTPSRAGRPRRARPATLAQGSGCPVERGRGVPAEWSEGFESGGPGKLWACDLLSHGIGATQ